MPAALLLLALCGAASVQAEEIKIGGTGAALGTMQMMADAYTRNHPGAKITLMPSLGSGGGIKAVLSGAIQIGLSARPLTEAEVKLGVVEIEYGRTPLVFATAAKNKTVSLTTQELVDIYAARTVNWADGAKLRVVMRPIGDSDSELIKTLSPALREAVSGAEQRAGMSISVTDQEAANSIEKIPGALGPLTLALILSEKRQFRALNLNGIVPNVKSIADGSYPLQKQLTLVTGPKTSPEAQAFVAFVRSEAGRKILSQTGHWVK